MTIKKRRKNGDVRFVSKDAVYIAGGRADFTRGYLLA